MPAVSPPYSLGLLRPEMVGGNFVGVFVLYYDGLHAILTLSEVSGSTVNGRLREDAADRNLPVTAAIDPDVPHQLRMTVGGLPGEDEPMLTLLMFPRRRTALAGWLDWDGLRLGCYAIRHHGLTLVTGHSGGEVRRWRARAGEHWDVVHRHETFVSTVAATQCEIVSGGDDGMVRWTPSGPQPMTSGPVLGRHEGSVQAIAFAAAGTAVVSAGEDGTVRLWDTTGQPIRQPLAAGDHAATCLVMLGDGRGFAGDSGDGTVRIWDWLPAVSPASADSLAPAPAIRPSHPGDGPNQGQPPPFISSALPGLAETVRSLVLAADGHTATVWDLADPTHPAQVRMLIQSPPAITAVAVDPDGRSAVTVGEDRIARVWDLSPTVDALDDLRGAACGIAEGGLAPSEWLTYVPEVPYRDTCR